LGTSTDGFATGVVQAAMLSAEATAAASGAAARIIATKQTFRAVMRRDCPIKQVFISAPFEFGRCAG
jgi:hypothetical protein